MGSIDNTDSILGVREAKEDSHDSQIPTSVGGNIEPIEVNYWKMIDAILRSEPSIQARIGSFC